jgi:hypothetical protein
MANNHLYECGRATQAGKYPQHVPQVEPARVGDDIEKIDPAVVGIQKCEKADGTLPCTDGIHHEPQVACQSQREAGEDKLAYTESSPATEYLPPNNRQLGSQQTQSQCTECSHDSLLPYNYINMFAV